MKLFEETNYDKDLRILREATDELLSHMKGHDWSFRREITDEKGDFSQEKLQSLLDEMLSRWEADKRKGRSKKVAGPYLEARRTLYRLYLCLVMRCSLCQGAYSDARKGAEMKERADFAFLLEQAERLSRSWCVMTGRDGQRRNEPYWGFDDCFGLHLYRPFREFASNSFGVDWSLTPDWDRACDHVERWTNEGNHKPVHIMRLGAVWEPEEAEDAAEAEDREDPTSPEEDYDGEESYDAGEMTPEEREDFLDDWSFWRGDEEFRMAEMDALSEEGSRELGLNFLWTGFEGVTEYLSACEEFVKLFRQAAPEVLRDFRADLEEIVDLYLVAHEIPPLMDTDKALNVYSRLSEGALRQAKRYGRGIQWKGL